MNRNANSARHLGVNSRRVRPWIAVASCFVLLLCGCKMLFPPSHTDRFSHFLAIREFSRFERQPDAYGQIVLVSPPLQSPIPWNELIVSWNVQPPAGTFFKVEAAAISQSKRTRFYALGQWSPDVTRDPRTSFGKQHDADGSVATDTLILNEPATSAQIRLTLGGTNATPSALKFLGLSFSNTKLIPAEHAPNRAAWGKIIAMPERSQHGYPGAIGWCSPTALSMVLSRWAAVSNRMDWEFSVPQVAAAVYDPAYRGTGNWSFNTAFAGALPGLRAYVTRFDDLTEVEDWIATGIPVILSAHWDLLRPGRSTDPEGHLIVCIGFTEDGDVIVNEPAAHPLRGESIRQTYLRSDVARAWAQSHNTVYLVYPERAALSPNRYGHF